MKVFPGKMPICFRIFHIKLFYWTWPKAISFGLNRTKAEPQIIYPPIVSFKKCHNSKFMFINYPQYQQCTGGGSSIIKL